MDKVLQTHRRTVDYLYTIFHDDLINAISSGWVLFRDQDNPEELGEVTADVAVNLVRVNVRRLITANGMDADSEAQSIVGELLIKLDEVLNKNDT